MNWKTSVLCLGLGLAGCKKPVNPASEPVTSEAFWETLASRSALDPARARMSVKIESPERGSPPLGGGLVTERPGKVYFAVLHPLGGPLLTLTSDGSNIGLMNARGKSWAQVADADTQLSELTGGMFEMDDFVGLLLGEVPLDREAVREETVVGEVFQFQLETPGETSAQIQMDPATATPRRLVVWDKNGATVVDASYEPFADVDGYLMPTVLEVALPSQSMTLTLRYKRWSLSEGGDDSRFAVALPDGFEELDLDGFLVDLQGEVDEQDSGQ